MATKNLARTVIEGGRYYSNCYFRRHSHRIPRMQWRALARELASDPESCWDGLSIEPLQPQGRYPRDKLGPAARFLRSRVGRPWNDVRSEIARKFDARTLAGWHVLHDHLLPAVESQYRGGLPRASFFVDARGILRERPRQRFRNPLEHVHLPTDFEQWLAGRRIGWRGTRAYWMVPTPPRGPSLGIPTRYRQHHELTEAELARWNTLDAPTRDAYSIVFVAEPERSNARVSRARRTAPRPSRARAPARSGLGLDRGRRR